MELRSKVWVRLKGSILGLAVAMSALGAGVQLTAAPQDARQDKVPPGKAKEKKIVDGELIVQFKATATDAEVADASAKAKLQPRKHIHTRAIKQKKQRGILNAATALQVEEAIEELKKHPAVEYAEPNWVYTHQAAANDPYYTAGYLWGVCGDLTSPSTPWGSQAAEAWNAGYTGTNAVYVGVIDEGIQVTHSDLAANMWTNPFDPADGLDNDGNGYADDVHGWNFYDSNNAVYTAGGDQHGTHVAGTIGAQGGNGTGVAGVNWNVTIISGKFLGADGGTTIDAIEAIEYFIDLKTRHGINLVALNNSWGGGGYSQALHDAIIRAAKAGILFIAAAGNGDWYGNGLNNDWYANYPSNYDTRQGTSTETAANYDAVIAVAAIDYNGWRATFSNYGARNVDIGAPGVSILSTLPGGYGYSDGTSMATPHVTGAVALYASTHPTATPQQIRTAVLSSVKATPSLSGITVTGGRLDLSTIVASGISEPAPAPTPSAPAAPTSLTAAAGTQRVTLSWSAVSNATSYVVKRAGTPGGPYTAIASGVTANTYVDANNILVGTTYYYVVAAVNATGTSPDSNEASASPLPAVPSAPTGTTATAGKAQVNGNSIVAVQWNAVTGATTYKVKLATSASGPFTVVATVSGTTFNDTVAANGTTYDYVVTAANIAGESPNSSAASVKPANPAPTNLSANAISRSQIRLSWVDQSSDETGFKVDYSVDGSRWYHLGAVGSTVTSPTVSGLAANRRYYFRVRAYNSSGNTAYSNTASARTYY